MPKSQAQCVLVLTRELGLVQLLHLELSPGIALCHAHELKDAADQIHRHAPVAILVDSHLLPPVDAQSVIDSLRMQPTVRIPVMLLAGEGMERAEVWKFHVDDYVILPADASAIAARVRALTRRAADRSQAPRWMRWDRVQIDLVRHVCTVSGEQVRLSRPEWRLLHVLTKAAAPTEGSDLLRGAWGEGFENDIEMLTVWIDRLRRALEPDPASPQIVLGDISTGYWLAPPDIALSDRIGLQPDATTPSPALPEEGVSR